jgi:hypothetical protein
MTETNLSSKLLDKDNDLARKTTFANDNPRRNTFSRAFTFDGAALAQTVAKPLEGLQRTLTEVGNRLDPDAKFTKSVLNDYRRVENEGNDGDVPLPKGFARQYKFWKLIFWGGIVACFMGVASAAFMNFADEVKMNFLSSNVFLT